MDPKNNLNVHEHRIKIGSAISMPGFVTKWVRGESSEDKHFHYLHGS